MVTNYLALGLICELSMLILGQMVYHNSLFDARMRRAFMRAIGGVGVMILAEMGSSYFTAPSSFARMMNTASCAIGFSMSPFLPFLVAAAVSRPEARRSVIFLLPVAVNAVLALLSPFLGFVFWITPLNEYVRGQWFFMYIISYLASFAFLVIETVCAVRLYQIKSRLMLFWLFSLFLVGTAMQVIWPTIHSTWPSISILLVFYYAYCCEMIETHDALTNLFNRRTYEHHLSLLKAKGRGAVVLLDADDFKSINDEYGHLYGDMILQVIAESLRASFSKIGTSHRIGGDEFCVLCENINEQRLQDAEALFMMRMEARRKQDPRIPFVSFGHVVYHHGTAGSIEQAIAEADRRMFQYKESQKLQRPGYAQSRGA